MHCVGLFTTSGENEHAALVCMDTVMCSKKHACGGAVTTEF